MYIRALPRVFLGKPVHAGEAVEGVVHAPVAQVGHIVAVGFDELATVELVRLELRAAAAVIARQAAGIITDALRHVCGLGFQLAASALHQPSSGCPHLADVAQVVAAVVIVTVALRHVAFRVVDAGPGHRQGAFARVLVVLVFIFIIDAARIQRAVSLAQQDGAGGQRAVHHHGHHLDAEEGGVVRLPFPPGSVIHRPEASYKFVRCFPPAKAMLSGRFSRLYRMCVMPRSSSRTRLPLLMQIKVTVKTRDDNMFIRFRAKHIVVLFWL